MVFLSKIGCTLDLIPTKWGLIVSSACKTIGLLALKHTCSGMGLNYNNNNDNKNKNKNNNNNKNKNKKESMSISQKIKILHIIYFK